MKDKRLIALFHRYIDKMATPAEKQELMALMAQPENDALVKELMNETWEEQLPEAPHFSEAESAAILQQVLATRAVTIGSRKPQRRIGMMVAAVTTGVLLLAAGAWWWQNSHTPAPVKLAGQSQVKNDIAPGISKATLQLADGSRITLDSSHTGTLARQGNVNIVQTNSGELAYNGTAAANATVQYNILTTPRGGEYQVTLPDGTKAWLNAASSLKYPTAFVGNTRTVELSGEAYFEVTANAAKPFTVHTNKSTIEVLGTHFNINAYADEKATLTTLLEGAVKVSSHNGQTILSPGQQANVNTNNGNLQVKTVDTEEAVAWKNDQFAFRDVDLPTVMRQIARWYDVEIVYAGTPATDEISGKISRNYNISQVLKMLEYTAGIKYSVDGHKVTIYN
ncbi:MAG: FecR domain-containing protein [Chitinophaga sp.]|uniref:FecR family protein n=1 Tax=Chitinophaga sp. TaxID=1869181 RepID=UPI001B241E7A|nr:FecR family protein [Chitinophaga sp.]MBO9730667.1 FecR domain-containing protein [Chitinophaga sp.]